VFAKTADTVAERLRDDLLRANFKRLVRRIALTRYSSAVPVEMAAMYFPNELEVIFLDGAFDAKGGVFGDPLTHFEWIAVHESAHIVDHSSGYEMSSEFGRLVGSSYRDSDSGPEYVPGNRQNLRYATTISGSKSIFEDFADSVAILLTAGAYMRGECGLVDSARLAACRRWFTEESR